MQDSLEGVEHRFRETAHKAVRIGDRLSKMEGQRARAAEAMDLLEFFTVRAYCYAHFFKKILYLDGQPSFFIFSTGRQGSVGRFSPEGTRERYVK